MATKHKGFSRRTIMDIAKIVRNNVTTPSNLLGVSRDLCDYFEQLDPTFQRKVFMDIALFKVKGDVRTEWCSLIEDKENA